MFCLELRVESSNNFCLIHYPTQNSAVEMSHFSGQLMEELHGFQKINHNVSIVIW